MRYGCAVAFRAQRIDDGHREAHVAGQHELVTDAARAAANLRDAHDGRGREAQYELAPKSFHLRALSRLGYVEMGDEKNQDSPTGTLRSSRMSPPRCPVISAPNSTVVVGTNMLIGGLLNVIVHRRGWVRSVLNCERSGMAHFLMLIGALLKVTWKPANKNLRASNKSALLRNCVAT
jgi:hypothetical protein